MSVCPHLHLCLYRSNPIGRRYLQFSRGFQQSIHRTSLCMSLSRAHPRQVNVDHRGLDSRSFIDKCLPASED